MDCVTLVLLVRRVELAIVLLLGDKGEALGAAENTRQRIIMK